MFSRARNAEIQTSMHTHTHTQPVPAPPSVPQSAELPMAPPLARCGETLPVQLQLVPCRWCKENLRSCPPGKEKGTGENLASFNRPGMQCSLRDSECQQVPPEAGFKASHSRAKIQLQCVMETGLARSAAGARGQRAGNYGIAAGAARTGACGMVRLSSSVDQGFATALIFSLRSRAAGCDGSCSACVRSRLARTGFSDVGACR